MGQKERHIAWNALAAAVPALTAFPPGLRGGVRRRALARGDTLFRLGERPRAMYVVLGGEVRLVRNSRGGTPAILQRATAGFIAEASFDQARYHCDAVAAKDSELAAIPIAAFQDALAERAFAQAYLRASLREVRRLRAQAERFGLRTVRERILHYIETEGVAGRIELPRTKGEWAAELGLTREALYRTLGAMRRSGEIRIVGNRVAPGHD